MVLSGVSESPRPGTRDPWIGPLLKLMAIPAYLFLASPPLAASRCCEIFADWKWQFTADLWLFWNQSCGEYLLMGF